MNRTQAEPLLEMSETTANLPNGLINPCLVFLEANDQGFPVLIACWAKSSQEQNMPGEPALLELRQVQIFGWYADSGKRPGPQDTPWLFRTGVLDLLQFEGTEPEIRLKAPGKASPLDFLGLDTRAANRMHVRALIPGETASISAYFAVKKIDHVSVAHFILKLGRLDWPSLSEASRSLKNQKERRDLISDERRVNQTIGLKRAVIKLGNLLSVADQIQAFGFARKTGEISVSNVPGPARINLVDGEIVDAQFGSLMGIDAAVALINLNDQQTEFIVGEQSQHRTIELPFLEVLCEAARIKDESPDAPHPHVAPEQDTSSTPFLRITLGNEIKAYPIRPGITYIGRSTRNDIVIADTTISQRHASVEFSPDGTFLKDLGSTNGTFVDGEAIAERWLGSQERLEFGGVRCLYNGPKK